jgi:hypothetical protein
LWIAASDLPMSPGHPFCARRNAGFDALVEQQCAQFKPRALQGALRALVTGLLELVELITTVWNPDTARLWRIPHVTTTTRWLPSVRHHLVAEGTSTTGC